MRLQKLPPNWITFNRFKEALINMMLKYSGTPLGLAWNEFYENIQIILKVILLIIFITPIFLFSLVMIISKVSIVTVKKVCGLI